MMYYYNLGEGEVFTSNGSPRSERKVVTVVVEQVQFCLVLSAVFLGDALTQCDERSIVSICRC